ncbi:hypothetical protein [Pseudomonas aeruginosa]|jgi:hypothetical protein|uniref:hypothetical protein n=2 Tax=Pseudomonas aeruginosa TaxID=287 RepID=UPI000EAE8EC0|nr:hypothetical protein [Pseudomonas aeruginosa]MCM1993597.1 hypothetical protein [Pseudomonas aeruginosa]MCM2002056.1 hypothetical protein [Pseudomonas aeruginosa]MCM2007009.1 hypothetical protein [Pseudomonas aeruginosa]MCM2016006.1 hypothetical protein [Pseudomonas aeruginosa]MCM2022787.1 hypothetical protein [Pseudomonas aeruginosa]
MHTQITRQDLFAAAALQGLLASGRHRDLTPEQIAAEASSYADALNKLAKPKSAAKPLTGQHFVVIEDAQTMKTTQGEYLELTLKVATGDKAGLRMVDRLYLQDGNAAIVEKAYGRLSAYCFATGQVQVQDPRQLQDIPFWASFGQSKGCTYLNSLQRSDGQTAPSWTRERVEVA